MKPHKLYGGISLIGIENGWSSIFLTGSCMLQKNKEIRMLPGLSEWQSPVSASEGVCKFLFSLRSFFDSRMRYFLPQTRKIGPTSQSAKSHSPRPKYFNSYLIGFTGPMRFLYFLNSVDNNQNIAWGSETCSLITKTGSYGFKLLWCLCD